MLVITETMVAAPIWDRVPLRACHLRQLATAHTKGEWLTDATAVWSPTALFLLGVRSSGRGSGLRSQRTKTVCIGGIEVIRGLSEINPRDLVTAEFSLGHS